MWSRAFVFAGVCIAMTLSAPSAAAQDNPIVVVETSLGNLTIELLQSDAPKSVENFLAYVNDGFFEGTVFHRVNPAVHDSERRNDGGSEPEADPPADRERSPKRRYQRARHRGDGENQCRRQWNVSILHQHR